jgi:phosphoribosylformimino-5-aminoimidazole carboxamide ribotide isomerase
LSFVPVRTCRIVDLKPFAANPGRLPIHCSFLVEKAFYCSIRNHNGRNAVKVIPVIDLLGGMVVHAVRGKRKEYLPLRSVLCNCSEPLAVAITLRNLDFKELYIADLDAILGNGSNLAVIGQIAEATGFRIMVDAGVNDLKRAEQTLQSGVSKVVVGTETLVGLDFVKDALATFGDSRVVVSLDLMNGDVLSKSEALGSMSPMHFALALQELGLRQLIVLDLARVGSDEGADFELLKNLTKAVDMKVYVGGGVRDFQDLKTLQQLGISGALIATALHTGKISAEHLHLAGFT